MGHYTKVIADACPKSRDFETWDARNLSHQCENSGTSCPLPGLGALPALSYYLLLALSVL